MLCQKYARKQFFGYHWHQIHGQLVEYQFLCHDECGVKQDKRGVFLIYYYTDMSLDVEGH